MQLVVCATLLRRLLSALLVEEHFSRAVMDLLCFTDPDELNLWVSKHHFAEGIFIWPLSKAIAPEWHEYITFRLLMIFESGIFRSMSKFVADGCTEYGLPMNWATTKCIYGIRDEREDEAVDIPLRYILHIMFFLCYGAACGLTCLLVEVLVPTRCRRVRRTRKPTNRSCKVKIALKETCAVTLNSRKTVISPAM